MAAQPGEDVAATLYADVHYFYGPPTAKPPHHRFDKSSYVYLYENISRRRARLEIANNAGTPDQDSFDGFLDMTRMEYTYKHPTLITLTVDGIGASNDHEWRLPTFDPRNEKKYLYRLHTVDIYFWDKEDAQLFLNAVRRMLPENQIIILDEPAAHHSDMSPVVQQLENVAISDPSYQQGRTQDSRPTASFPGPPTSAVPQPEGSSKPFMPMAYNPAAPAAPETIRHREKTPPPEDGAANPLAAAALSDQGQSMGSVGHQQFAPPPTSTFGPNQTPYFPGPPRAGNPGSPYASPPPSALNRTQSFPQTSPSAPLQSPGFSPHSQYSQPSTVASVPPAPPAPPGGYSTYQYTQAESTPLADEYSIHQQIYRPTEGEAAVKNKPVKPPRGRLEDNAQKLEKGVTGLLKKFEKKYG